MSEKTATRQLILEAVVACIEKYGVDHVTTRKIAQEAGTNIASINYYFRSKEDLMSETLAMTIRHMMEDVFVAIDDTGQPFEQVLSNVLFYLVDGARQFPGISRAHLYRAVVQRDDGSVSAEAMKRVYDRLADRAVKEYPAQQARQVRLALSDAMSAILFTMLAPGFFPLPRDYQPTSSRNSRRLADWYARQLVTMMHGTQDPEG